MSAHCRGKQSGQRFTTSARRSAGMLAIASVIGLASVVLASAGAAPAGAMSFAASSQTTGTDCVAVAKITPSQLYVGRIAALTIRLKQHGAAVTGVHVRLKGPRIDMVTTHSNGSGVVKVSVIPMRAGVLSFLPMEGKSCYRSRVGIAAPSIPITG